MHLYGQPFGGVLEKKFFYFLFFLVKNEKKTTFLKINDFLVFFLSIKMQAATNWSSHLKNIKHSIFFKRQILMQFSKITFSEIF